MIGTATILRTLTTWRVESSPSYEQETGGGGRAANDPVLSGALADLNKPVADVLASHEHGREEGDLRTG